MSNWITKWKMFLVMLGIVSCSTMLPSLLSNAILLNTFQSLFRRWMRLSTLWMLPGPMSNFWGQQVTWMIYSQMRLWPIFHSLFWLPRRGIVFPPQPSQCHHREGFVRAGKSKCLSPWGFCGWKVQHKGVSTWFLVAFSLH